MMMMMYKCLYQHAGQVHERATIYAVVLEEPTSQSLSPMPAPDPPPSSSIAFFLKEAQYFQIATTPICVPTAR